MSALPLPFIFVFRQHKKLLITAALMMLALLGGIVRYQAAVPVVNENSVQFYNDKTAVELKGTVSQAPDVRDKSTHLYFSGIEMKTAGGWQKLNGEVLIFVPRFPVYNYGDELLVKGKLETPQTTRQFRLPGLPGEPGDLLDDAFPADILNRHGQRVPAAGLGLRVKKPVVAGDGGDHPRAAGLAGAGDDTGHPRQYHAGACRTTSSSSGTMYILVISGSQFNIVAGILVATGIWLFGKRRFFYIWLALAAIWIYALLTGMGPPVIRSAVMVSIFLFADLLGRQKSAMTAIGFAAAVMAAITPKILGDASFQLTFLSVVGMALITPRLQTWGKNIISRQTGRRRVFREDGELGCGQPVRDAGGDDCHLAAAGLLFRDFFHDFTAGITAGAAGSAVPAGQRHAGGSFRDFPVTRRADYRLAGLADGLLHAGW